MSERLNTRLRQALNDSAASQELIDFLGVLDPDGDGAIDAAQVVYDPTASGLAAVDAQAAIDENNTIADQAVADALAAQDSVNAITSGTDTVLNGATSVVVAVGAAFNGKLAVVGFGALPVAAGLVWAGPVAAGNLTINIDVDNTADMVVNYIVDGR